MESAKNQKSIIEMLPTAKIKEFMISKLLKEGYKQMRFESGSKKHDDPNVETNYIRLLLDDDKTSSAAIVYEQSPAGMRIVDVVAQTSSNNTVSLKKEFFEFLISEFGINEADRMFQEYIKQYSEFLKAGHDLPKDVALYFQTLDIASRGKSDNFKNGINKIKEGRKEMIESLIKEEKSVFEEAVVAINNTQTDTL